MTAAVILLATLKFVCWETVVLGASMRLARLVEWRPEDRWLAILAIDITLESSLAGVLSFAGWNSVAAYWAAAAFFCAVGAKELLQPVVRVRGGAGIALMGALTAPLVLLAFRPVEEIDSINYLHYLIEWMGNRATPFTFATNYVAFWELSFLPAWMLTGMDWFFPLLALKAVVLLALAAWLFGRELGLRAALLLWGVFTAVTMRHYWFSASGVPTLKNDVLHGAGFLLITLAVMRMTCGRRMRPDLLLLAFGVAFASVKYTGVFLAVIALALVWGGGIAPYLLFLATSGPYYLRNLFRYGSPFYPFQINLGLLHLPGTADLSYTSILYSIRDPEVWRFLFVPHGGLSPAGLLFPFVLAAILPVAVWRLARAGQGVLAKGRDFAPTSADVAAAAILCGWLLYFRSVYSASAGSGDLAFLRNGLNSIRYVDGVLAASELYLLALVARWRWVAWGALLLQLVSRLYLLYSDLSLQVMPVILVVLVAVTGYIIVWRQPAVWAGLLVLAGPFVVERNRVEWTRYWDDLKPALAEARTMGLGDVELPDGGFYAAHVVAAGNPVHRDVRSLSMEDWAGMSDSARPHYLAVLVMPGSGADGQWRQRDGPRLADWGYRPVAEGRFGAVFARETAGPVR